MCMQFVSGEFEAIFKTLLKNLGNFDGLESTLRTCARESTATWAVPVALSVIHLLPVIGLRLEIIYIQVDSSGVCPLRVPRILYD